MLCGGIYCARCVVLLPRHVFKGADSGADPYGVLKEGEIYFKSTKVLKEVGDLNPRLLLGDVLVRILCRIGYSDPPMHILFRFIVTQIAFPQTFRRYAP